MTGKQPVRRRGDTDAPTPDTSTPEPAPAAEAPAPAPRAAQPSRDPRIGRRVVDPTAPEPKALSTAETPTSTRLSELEAFARMDSLDMESLLAASGRTKPPEPGTKVSGTVIRLTGDGVHVDIGGRAEGWISRKELPAVKVGDTVEAFVLDVDELGIQLSAKLTGDAAARHLEEALEGKIPVDGKIEARSNAGYTVRVGPVRAFCPMRLMSRIPLADPDALIGQTLPFLVVETGEKVVVSRRELEEADTKARREARLATLKEGDIVTAVVTNVQTFGVFLDVDGVDVMLPRKEAAWEEISDLTSRFERGQRLDVRVIRMEPDGGRIAVTCRDPGLDPWNTITALAPVGTVHQGRVVTQTEFGAFVEILPGLQGLVHAKRVSKVPSAGSLIDVRVISIDTDRRRLELAPSDFDPAVQAQNVVGVEVSGEVTEVSDRGIGVRLADGRRAWLPSREVELTPGTVIAQRFRVGHAFTARITSDEKGRVTLTQRAQDSDDWRDAMRAQASAGGQKGMGTFADLLGKLKR